MEDAAGPQPVLGGLVALAHLPQDVFLGDADVVVDHFAVVRLRTAPHPDAPDDVDALGGGGHDELGHLSLAAFGVGVAVGHPGHDDEELGVDAVGGEPLVAVDDPVVAVEHGRGGQRAGVRPGVFGLGHGEARLHLPVDHRQQPVLLLLLGAVLDQDGLITGVGGHHPEQRCPPDRVGQHLVHVGVGQEIQAHPAILGGQVRRPQAGLQTTSLISSRSRTGPASIEVGGFSVLP